MKTLVVAAALLGLALAGCGNAEKQQQAQAYEQFLKSTLGTVVTDAAPSAVN